MDLQERSLHFGEILRHADTAAYIVQQTTGCLTDTNAQLLHDLGYQRDQLIGRPVQEILNINPTWNSGHTTPEYINLSALTQAVRSGTAPPVFSGTHHRADGTQYPVHAWMICGTHQHVDDSLIITRTQHPHHLHEPPIYPTDISKVMDRIGSALVALDRNWRYTFVNEQAGRILGHKPNDLIGQTIWDVFPDATDSPFYDLYHEAIEQQIAKHTESYSTALRRWVDVWAYPSKDGLSIIFQDVTERKQDELKLRASEERMRVLVSQIPAALWTTDKELRFTTAHGQMLEQLKADPNAITGTTLYDFYKTNNPNHHSLAAHQRALQGDSVTYERQWHGRTFETHIEPFNGLDGTIIGCIGMSLDISDRKAAEAEIHQLNESLEKRVAQRTTELQSANAELQAFSYSLSHDLRAVIRSVEGFSTALAHDYAHALDQQANDYIRRIGAATERMRQIIDDLMKLSRLSKVELNRGQVDLSRIAQNITDEIRERIGTRKVHIDIEDGLTTTGDARLLRLALVNLIENAWKFTQYTDNAVIEIGRATPPSVAPVYFVRDNGAGFDMEYADKLFKPFQRLHADHEFEGTGIGLATVLRIIQRHGGHIWAKSTVGQGATIFFTL